MVVHICTFYYSDISLVASNRKGLRIDRSVISMRGVNMNELNCKFFDTPDKCLFYLESQALQYIQFKDNNAEYRRLINEGGLTIRIALSTENFSKTATPEHTDLVKRIRNNDFKTLDDFYKNLGSRGKPRPRGKLLKDLKKRTNQTQFQKEKLGNAFIENKLLLSEAKKVAFELAEIDADNALVQTTALKLSKQFSTEPLSEAQMITHFDFIERQISKHLKLDRVEAKILDEDNKDLYFMWGKIKRRYTKGDAFTLPTGQVSKLVHCSKSEIVPIMKKLEKIGAIKRIQEGKAGPNSNRAALYRLET